MICRRGRWRLYKELNTLFNLKSNYVYESIFKLGLDLYVSYTKKETKLQHDIIYGKKMLVNISYPLTV